MSERSIRPLSSAGKKRRDFLLGVAAMAGFSAAGCSTNRQHQINTDPLFDIPEFHKALNGLEGQPV